MRIKGFALSVILVIITASAGCDNVEWDGSALEVEPPPPTAAAAEPPEVEEGAESELEPLELGPLLYLVERTGSERATLLPVAELADDGYAPLPDPAETPDLVERFPMGRWEEGTEFVLFSRGVRAGILTADGSAREDATLCLPRAVGEGSLELRPAAGEVDRFLAMRRDEGLAAASPLAPYPEGGSTGGAALDASVDAATCLIAEREVPWPPSIPGIRRRVDVVGEAAAPRMLAASFVFGDELVVGRPEPTAYSLFFVAREEEGAFDPVFSWYQRADTDGKAFPGFLAAHDVRGVAGPDFVLEVFDEEGRGLAILETAGDAWDLVYRDPCAGEPAGGALRIHPG